MQEKLLSQDEINALLGGAQGRGKPAGQSSPERRLKPSASAARSAVSSRNLFPILRPQGLGLEVEEALAVVLDTFAQNGCTQLATALRAQVDLRVEGTDQVTYREFVQGLPETASIWSLRLKPMGLNIALCLEARLVHAIVDLLMGGVGKCSTSPRSITELDQSVVESIVQILHREFQEAWGRLVKFEIEEEGRETRPALLQLYPPGENMISILVSMKAGRTQGQLFWGLPGLLLQRSKNRVESQVHGRSGQTVEQARSRIREALLQVPTELQAVIDGTRIRVAELLELRNGDVVRLEHRIEEPVAVLVNDVPKHSGQMVLSRGRKSVQIQ